MLLQALGIGSEFSRRTNRFEYIRYCTDAATKNLCKFDDSWIATVDRAERILAVEIKCENVFFAFPIAVPSSSHCRELCVKADLQTSWICLWRIADRSAIDVLQKRCELPKNFSEDSPLNALTEDFNRRPVM